MGTKKIKIIPFRAGFIIRSDHKPLGGLICSSKVEGTIAIWLDYINEFDFKIQYRAGNDHLDADGMSRCNAITRIIHPLPVDYQNFKIMQEQDEDIKWISNILECYNIAVDPSEYN